MTTACAAPAVNVAIPEPQAIAINWLPNCASRLDETFFSVRIKSDGSAEFRGARQARTLGTVELKIDAAQASAVAAAANVAISEARDGTKSVVPDSPQDVALCMEVTMGGSQTTVTGRVSVKSVAGGQLLDEVVRSVPLQRLVCPNRRTGGFASLRYEDLCQRWYSAPAIMAVFEDRAGCPGIHSVNIYDDGTIYYNAHVWENVDGKRVERTIGEQFVVLSAAELHDLFGLVATFDFRHSYFPNSATEEEAKEQRRTNDPVSMQKFKAAMTSEKRIQFVTIPPVVGTCSLWKHEREGARLYVRWGLNLNPDNP